MRSHKQVIASALALAAIATTTPVLAGPTVLRDDQLRDLAVTPVLGRGYSLATNTFQSICLQDIQKTKPSYNFYYRFEQSDQSGSSSSNTSTTVGANYSGGGFGVSAKVDASAKVTTIDNQQYYNQYLAVTTTVDEYYSSVDESKAKMSDAANELLRNNDILGFFNACGLYYIRSIGRRGTFVSVFNYKTTSSSRDLSFEAKLEAQLKGFGQSGGVSVQSSGDFKNEASSKYLTIESTAMGLGKDEKASLIAYDLDTFRAAIKDAFTSMQADDVGMVTSIEVSPWVENTEFQRTLKLGEPKQGADGKTIDPYVQKLTLNQNGEFLSEIDRAARAKLNVYYKAKQCRARVDLDYKTGNDFLDPYKSANVVNHRTGATMPLAQLDAALDPSKIDAIYAEQQQFIYGAGGDDGGAVACIRDLFAAGMTTTLYRAVPSCQKIEKQFAVLSGQQIDEFCMPKLAP
jgi:hypothetical protein